MSSQEELNVSNEDLEKKLAKLVSTLGMHLCYNHMSSWMCWNRVSSTLVRKR